VAVHLTDGPLHLILFVSVPISQFILGSSSTGFYEYPLSLESRRSEHSNLMSA